MFTLLEKLNKLDAVTLTHETEGVREEHGENYYSCLINLGGGFAGDYKGGYWGDCSITDDELELHFLYGNVYGDDDLKEGEGFPDWFERTHKALYQSKRLGFGKLAIAE